ncbi:MAG: LacI family DNA-binding transcriptional regulator [Lewinellaceae bacterium]|nr:LacI family DNA-binding transcriptional regulator [Lewinellaceae bacterium]
MDRKKKEVTIYDIAEKLNVSAATVSRALRNHPAVSAKTKKRINDLAESFGYQTNQFARNLRQQQTKTIGVIVPRLNSYFMATVISGIEHVANEAGYNLLISQSSELPDRENAIAKTMFNNRVDGVLVSLSYLTGSLQHFNRFSQKNIPVIFFDRTFETEIYTNIRINNLQAGYDATKHLLEKGCRRILHVSVSSTHSIYQERFKGYAKALQEFGIPLHMDYVHLGDLSLEAGIRAAQYALELPQRPDGIFVANDNCAAGCIIALKKAGIRIPEDIAIVGFNDDPVCRIVEPNLTTIHYPGYEMGKIAAHNLINQLSGSESLILTQTISLRSDLIVRQALN